MTIKNIYYTIESKIFLVTFVSILLFSTSVVMFANEVQENEPAEQQQMPQAEQKIELENEPTFKSDYNEYSLAEKDFASKFDVNPRNTSDVWFKYKSLIHAGIGMAIAGGLMYTVGTPTLLGIGLGLMLVPMGIIGSIVLWACSGLLGLAGIIVQSLCAVPFAKSATLAGKYKNIYNVKLKQAAVEATVLSMHNCENKEAGMAIAFGIK